MANTFEDYTVSTSTTNFNITFEYLEDSHVVVEIDGVLQSTSAYSVVAGSPNQVQLNSAVSSGVVRIRRDSNADSDNPFVDFVNGSVLTETELDKSYRHNLYLNEEIENLNEQSLQKKAGSNDWDAKSNKIINVTDPTLVQDAATKNYTDTQITNAVSGSSTEAAKTTFTGNASTTVFTFSSGITLDGDTMYEVAIDGVLQEPTVAYAIDADANTITFTSPPPNSSKVVVIQRGYAVPVTTGSVTTAQVNDSAITTAKIADSAITDAKLASGVAMTSAERTKLTGIATSANNYVHPNHTGDVTSTADGATVIGNNKVTAAMISSSDALLNTNTTHSTIGIGATASSSGSYPKVKMDGGVQIGDQAATDTNSELAVTGNGSTNLLTLENKSTGASDNSSLVIKGADTAIQLYDTVASANEGKLNIQWNGGSLLFAALNDDNSLKQSLLRIDSDGSVHIKSGQSVTADL